MARYKVLRSAGLTWRDINDMTMPQMNAEISGFSNVLRMDDAQDQDARVNLLVRRFDDLCQRFGLEVEDLSIISDDTLRSMITAFGADPDMNRVRDGLAEYILLKTNA